MTYVCDYIKLDESVMCTFLPPNDDTFASTSHECIAVVETPDGNWLFSKPLTEPSGNTPQNA